LPNSWELEESAECLSLFDPKEGVGTCQISCYSFPPNRDVSADDILLDYLNDKDIIGSPPKLKSGSNSGLPYASTEYVDKENSYWDVWVIVQKNKVVLITYNCKLEDVNKEKKLFHNLVKSVEIIE
jgi:hypothetical protein